MTCIGVFQSIHITSRIQKFMLSRGGSTLLDESCEVTGAHSEALGDSVEGERSGHREGRN
jgi:hypothetical protein